MERKRNKPKLKSIENFQCSGDAVSNQSALVFKGRAILKNIYLQYNLLSEEEERSGIQMPEDSFLMVVPRLESEGLDATAEFLTFTKSGISINSVEGGYDHASREKLALLFIICNAEMEKPLNGQFLVKDELKSIKKMSQLAEWISNMQHEKDVRRVLEREHAPKPMRTERIPVEDKLLSKKELAGLLSISTKTIDRHPKQFIPIKIGDRNFYKYSECSFYKKPGI
nr:hypothetical protein [uncultured Pedobacter sp.]